MEHTSSLADEISAARRLAPCHLLPGGSIVDPKAWLIAVTAVAAFVAPADGYAARRALVGAVGTRVGLPCMTLWAACGAGLRQGLRSPGRFPVFTRTMAVPAAATAGLIWL